LLDTATFLFAALDDPRLSRIARDLIVGPDDDVFLSVISSWEISVKHSLNRLQLPEPPDRFVPAVRERMGLDSLPLEEAAALGVSRLPRLHADPFDRMLVAQAITHGLTVITPDELVRQYPVPTAW
jgi:PIN domain nuclease of toxin-antitoxin system